MTYAVRAFAEDDWELLRRTRLQALADAPTAFGSTLAREQSFAEEVWRQRAKGSSTTRIFVAQSDAAAVGITGILDEGDGTAQLVSVWVDPEHRGRGVARRLATAALGFASRQGFEVVRLWVTEGNARARTLYEHLGFTPTGRRQPLPSDPTLDEHELELRRPQAAGAAPR